MCTQLDKIVAVFQVELEALQGEVHLEVEQGTTPVIAPRRRASTSLKKKLKEELDRLKQLEEVIAPSMSSLHWLAGCEEI